MQVVEIQGVGEIEFPDDMTQEQIKSVLDKKFGHSQPVAPSAPQQIQQVQRGMTEVLGSGPEVNRPVSANLLGDPLAEGVADIRTGAPFAQRMAASVKITPEGKVGYLESIYGKGNVSRRADGEIFYRHPETGKWTQFDERGVSWSDIADLAGGALEAAPAVAAGIATANPFAIAGAAGAGSAIRQGVSGAIPGQENLTLGERAARVGTSAAFAGAAQAGSNLLFQALDKVRPHNIVASKTQEGIQSQVGRRGQFLQEKTGIEFTPGQLSGSRTQLMLEGLARRHPKSADIVASKVDEKQIDQAVRFLTRSLDRIDDRGLGDIDVGTSVNNAFRSVVDKAVNVRSAQAKADFGIVKELGGTIQSVNAKNTIKELIDEFDVPGGGDATQAVVNRLKRLSSDLGDEIAPQQFQRLLQIYGSASKGTGQIFTDIDKSQQRMIAGRVMNALMKDLDDAAQAGTPAAEALKVARDNYRANSQKINELGETVLGRMFNGKFDPSPESVVDRFMRMKPSEIKTTMSILDTHDAATANAVRRRMVEKAVEAAVPSGSQGQIAGQEILGGRGIRITGGTFSPAKFNSFIQKNADLYRAALSPKDAVQIKRGYEAFARLADRARTEGSPTAPLLFGWDASQGSFVKMAQDALLKNVRIVPVEKIARAIATPEGRNALMALAETSPRTKAHAASAAYLTSVFAREE